MKTMKHKILKLALVGSLMIGASSANATCTLFGYGIRVVTFEGQTYLMFKTHTFGSNHYYQGLATDPQVAAAAYQGFKGGSRLYIRTKDASCPTPIAGKNTLGVIDRIGLAY